MPFWHRLVIAGAVFLVVSLVARVVDAVLARKTLEPVMVTRYRVLRRSITAVILVVGFSSQPTLGNFVAGLLIAITQPVRLGDRVTYAGETGIIEDIGLTYTFIRTSDGARLV